MTTTVTVNLDLPTGVVTGDDFSGAFSTVGSITGRTDASSVTLAATDATGGPASWSLLFRNTNKSGRRTNVSTPVPAGPVNFTVTSGALSTLAWVPSGAFAAAFPNGLPVGTQVTVAGGSLPAGLVAGSYFVVSTAAAGFSLSATAGGSAITCTSAGVGTITVTAYNYSALLTASQSRTATPERLPYPSGLATPGNTILLDSNGSPTFSSFPSYNDGLIQPADMGFVAWTALPSLYSSAYTLRNINGWFYLWRFRSANGGIVNNITYAVTTAASGTATANVYLGIYDDVGNLLGSCATDQTTNMASTGVKTATLSAPVYLAPNTLYRIGLVVGTVAGSTQPALANTTTSAAGANNNLGKATFATMISCVQQSGTGFPFSSLPNPVTQGAFGANTGNPVFGLS